MTSLSAAIPQGLTCYKRTAEFTRANVPAALLRRHNTKPGVWGLLRVLRGRVRYCIDDPDNQSTVVTQPGTAVIEPEVPHHVELVDEDSAFLVEFYRLDAAT